MNRKILLPAILILVCSVLISRAQKSRHAAVKDGSTYARFLSVNQWTNISDGQQESGHSYTIVWKGTQPPETFFWHPKEGGWMTCEVKRIHPKTHTEEVIDLLQVRKGDTLDVKPLSGGRDVMPKIIPASSGNRLYFMVKRNSNWWYLNNIPAKKK